MRHCGQSNESRSSALWGTGNRGGEHRSSALWGTGNRGGDHRSRGSRARSLVITGIALVALLIPVAAGAERGKGGDKPKGYVAPSLLKQAKENPGAKVRVIVQSVQGSERAADVAKGKGGGKVKKHLRSADGVAVELPAAAVEKLADVEGLTVTPDRMVKLFDLGSDQAWPYATGLDQLWGTSASPAPQAPAIAILDSGVEANRLDFNGRVVAEVNLATLTPNSAGDGRGHGTFVAGVAAGSAPGFAGAAAAAPIVSVDVINDNGEARVSDVIVGIDWILANKDAHNIRVANFSLGAGAGSIHNNPLNDAVEKLWLGGVVVVASAGNYGVDGAMTGVRTAPANDPFVITVGAVDVAATVGLGDDYVAPWSVWGYTADAFRKPEVSAAGRYMIGPVPANATLPAERPENMLGSNYMRLSGTSFSAPVVAGAAAQILARHPSWTPDMVKGALMLTARSMPLVTNNAGGVGHIDALSAASVTSPPNPNAGLNQFLVPDPAGGPIPVFDEQAWHDAAAADPSGWDQAGWSDAGWSDAGWSDAGWSDAGWSDAGWSDAGWSDAGWSDAGWSDAGWSDAGWSETASAENADGEGAFIPTPPPALFPKIGL